MKNRSLLMIPGPIEFDPAVLAAMSVAPTSHTVPAFIEIFGQALEKTRKVFLSEDGQPFVVPGSGTLAMDMAACNMIEPGDKALVINTGFFSERFGSILERYGAQVTHYRCAIGDVPDADEVEKVLKQGGFKVMTVTQVDTSTGVLVDVKEMSELAHRYGVMIFVDGVCSIAGEALRMTEWDIDIALTASQKAISVPPGLAILVAGPRAMKTLNERKTPVPNYYGDMKSWLPTMIAYEGRKPSYFGTPAINLVNALNVSLGQILEEGMEARFKRHARFSAAFKAGILALGLKLVPNHLEWAAHTLTNVYLPDGITQSAFIGEMMKDGVIPAAGLHPAIREKYFRVGHMGPVNQNDLFGAMGAVETALKKCGYHFKPGSGLAALSAGLLA